MPERVVVELGRSTSTAESGPEIGVTPLVMFSVSFQRSEFPIRGSGG